MKKTLLALSCCAFMSIHAQTDSSVVSLMYPWKSDGYISWNKKSGTNYKVKIYQMVDNNYVLISTNTITGSRTNFFKFNSSNLASPDLFYTIADYSSQGVLMGESSPVAIGNQPPSVSVCSIDCNGNREAYSIHLMARSNGSTYLAASETATTYYQAIRDVSYNQLDELHPYKRKTANGTGNQLTYVRDHIRITNDIVGHPFRDANNVVVPANEGWLIEKKMDKFMHYNGANTGNHQPSTDLCDANIGFISNVFNDNIELSSLTAPVGTIVTDEQAYFLDETNTPSGPVYLIPNSPLTCSVMPNGGGGPSGPPPGLGDFYDHIAYCFDMGTSDAGGDPLDCLIPDGPIGGGIDGTIDGFTIESMSKDIKYSVFVNNSTGTVNTNGAKYFPGLYRMNVFLNNGQIYTGYRTLGDVNSVEATDANVSISLSPNPIVDNKLRFKIFTDVRVKVDLMVFKLDGTILFSGKVNLNPATGAYFKELDVTGNVPYNQLRVSVILPDGTVIQETALTL